MTTGADQPVPTRGSLGPWDQHRILRSGWIAETNWAPEAGLQRRVPHRGDSGGSAAGASIESLIPKPRVFVLYAGFLKWEVFPNPPVQILPLVAINQAEKIGGPRWIEKPPI